MYVKSERKAHVLYAIQSIGGPVTVGSIIEQTNYARSTVRDILNRLLIERSIEKKKFGQEGINPCDYRICEQGKSPKFFYVIKPLGLKKLMYFKNKGLLQL